MTDELHAQFERASKDVKELPERPSNDDMLSLYALYKQGSKGDVSGERPGFMDFVGGAKFDAWSKLAGMDREEAMRNYIDKVESMKT